MSVSPAELTSTPSPLDGRAPRTTGDVRPNRRQRAPKRYTFLDNALMSREMDRL